MAFDVDRPQPRKRRRPNGMTVDVRTAPLPDGGYISVVTDITPLTEAEAEVSRRAEEMAVMLSSIRHGVDAVGTGPAADRQQRHRRRSCCAIRPACWRPGRPRTRSCEDMLAARPFRRGRGGAARASRMLAQLDRSKPYLRQVATPAGRVLDVRSDPTPARRLGHHLHRRDRGARRGGRTAPRQGSGGGGQPGEVALPGHDEP